MSTHNKILYWIVTAAGLGLVFFIALLSMKLFSSLVYEADKLSTQYPEYRRLVLDDTHAGFKELKIVDSAAPHLNKLSSSKNFDGIPIISYQYNRAEAKVTDAYLLFEGFVNGNDKSGEALYPDDSLYFKMNNFGGHIIATQGRVETPQKNGFTRWMFNLGNMAFYQSTADRARKTNSVSNADFIQRLNWYAKPHYKVDIFAAIVSNRPTTEIQRLSIFYKMESEGDSIEKV